MELVSTRKELKGQKKQLEAQNKTFIKQSFENSFFQLTKFHNDFVYSLEICEMLGKNSFVKLKEDIYSSLSKQPDNIYNQEMVKEEIHAFFYEEASVFNDMVKYSNELILYCNSIFNILTFIKQSEIVNKNIYINFFRVQLSLGEMQFLFYFCLTGFGKEKLKQLIEEFAIFKNLTKDDLINKKDYDLYNIGAYEEKT